MGGEGRPGSYLLQEGCEGSSEGDSGKDSDRFTDSERGSPTVGGSRRKELGERGAAILRQVSNFLLMSRHGSCSTPLRDVPSPRRSCCSIETDSRGTVTVPVPFIQPPKPWI